LCADTLWVSRQIIPDFKLMYFTTFPGCMRVVYKKKNERELFSAHRWNYEFSNAQNPEWQNKSPLKTILHCKHLLTTTQGKQQCIIIVNG